MCRAPATMSVTAASMSFARICAPISTASRSRMSSTGTAGIRRPVTYRHSGARRSREPGIHIPEAGVRIGFISGSSIAAMRLAMPDMDLLTFPEMADAVETCIAAAPKVLWLADGDTGYGNALAVQKTIRAYARRGGRADRGQGVAAPARASGGEARH